MGVDGRLGPKKLRHFEALAGESLLFAVATYNPYVVGVTLDDRHVVWNRSDGTVTVEASPDSHFTSCPATVAADIANVYSATLDEAVEAIARGDATTL